jgi:5-methylcytosine-specific restriction enzyme subunit McrC
MANLFHLLDPTGDLALADDRAAPASGAEILDFLAGRLVRLLNDRAAAGLHRGYAERCDSGPYLQGQLDLPAQLRDPNIRKDHFHCRYEEFTADIPCNQVPRATAELVLRSPLVGESVRTALRQSLSAFTEVRPIPLGSDSFQAALPDRLTEAYRPLLELCRLLTESLGPGDTAGSATCPSFLLDLERVFERYVTGGIVTAFSGKAVCTVSIQPLLLASAPAAGQPDLRIRPDILIDHAGQPRMVIDAKWKGKAGGPLMTEDVYQVLAYGSVLGARRGVLVYPGRSDRLRVYPLQRTGFTLQVRTLRVIGSRAECAASLDRLGVALTTGRSPQATAILP